MVYGPRECNRLIAIRHETVRGFVLFCKRVCSTVDTILSDCCGVRRALWITTSLSWQLISFSSTRKLLESEGIPMYLGAS